MKKHIAALVLVPCALLAGNPALAHPGHQRIDNRLERQQERIEQGIASGELTRKEAKYLKRGQKRLRKQVRKFGRDGRYSKKERRKLVAQLDRASEDIRDFKHNSSHRPRVRHRHGLHFRDYWRDADNHRWSYELSFRPYFNHR